MNDMSTDPEENILMTDADCLPGKQKFCHSEAVLKQFHFCTPFLMHSEPDFHLCVCHRRADVMGRSFSTLPYKANQAFQLAPIYSWSVRQKITVNPEFAGLQIFSLHRKPQKTSESGEFIFRVTPSTCPVSYSF